MANALLKRKRCGLKVQNILDEPVIPLEGGLQNRLVCLLQLSRTMVQNRVLNGRLYSGVLESLHLY